MKLNLKQLALSAAVLGLLAVGMAVPATAASPFAVSTAIVWPWESVSVETVETGDYAASMTVGTAQQLSPVVSPSKAARRNPVSYVSDNPNIVAVTEDGVAQAVGLGTANIAATAGGVSCVYTITTQPDSTMIPQELDITLQSNTIYVGDNTSCSLAVLPTTAANYISVTLTSSDPGIATVNNFGKVTGIAPGTATITVTCGEITASAKITVVEKPASSSAAPTQSLNLSTNYIVLKPGASRSISGKVTPSSASQSLTFKSQDTKVAQVNSKGVITGVGTGATSVIVTNGTVSASVTVIVNRNATSSNGSNSGGDGTEAPIETDPIVEAIEAANGGEVTYTTAEIPVITSDILNALRRSNAALTVTADDYSLRIAGSSIKNTAAAVDTALTFSPDAHGLAFTLNNGEALPGTVDVVLHGEAAGYGRLYLYNASSEKWQFLNSYRDGVISADTAGDYLLTNENLRFADIDWTFFLAGGVVVIGCVIAYIAVKKRYWFW